MKVPYRLAVDLFAVAVVVSVALASGGLIARLAGYTGETPVAVPAVRHVAAPPDVDGLVALAPFGTALSGVQTPGGGPLRLKGILLAIPASASTALIAGPDGKVASYAVGAPINGGTVDAIGPDTVVVRMPGGLQTLAFAPDMDVPSGSPLAPVVKPGPTAPDSPISGGLRVGPSAPALLFAAGLHPGDVVEQLNGAPVDADTSERDLIARVTRDGAAQVVVMRNGQRVSLNLAIH